MKTNNDFRSFFPTDNSGSTNLKYDLVASKFMTGIENHQRTQYNNSVSNVTIIPLIGAFIQIGIGAVILIFSFLRLIYKSLK